MSEKIAWMRKTNNAGLKYRNNKTVHIKWHNLQIQRAIIQAKQEVLDDLKSEFHNMDGVKHIYHVLKKRHLSNSSSANAESINSD